LHISGKMKNLVKYAKQNRNVVLEDYFGEEHIGKIIVEKFEEGEATQNHYFFQREDGATIRIYNKGFARVFEKEENKLGLTLRDGCGHHLTPEQYNPRTEAIESCKFENMRVK